MDLNKLIGIEITLSDGRKTKITNAEIGSDSIIVSVEDTNKRFSLKTCLERKSFIIDNKELIDEIQIANKEIQENKKRENQIENEQRKQENAEITKTKNKGKKSRR